MRVLAFAALAVLAALALAFFLLRTPDTDPEAMTAKYGGPPSKFVENAEGLRVHYRDQGNPDGAPIILLHGSSASLHTWEPLVKRLGGDYRIITYDQPGHGLTGEHPRDDYSFAGMADALDLVTEELGLESFVLGGNSMGGWVSWRYALKAPEKVEGLILIDAGGAPLREGEEAPPLNIGFRLARNPVGRFFLKHFTPRGLIEKSIRETVSVQSIVTDAYVDQYWELLRYPGNRRASAFRFAADREPSMADHLSQIETPTLIIWGAEDNLVYPSAADTFREKMPNVVNVVVYEGVGHLPMEEAPQRTAGDIRRFMESLAEPVDDQLKLEHAQ